MSNPGAQTPQQETGTRESASDTAHSSPSSASSSNDTGVARPPSNSSNSKRQQSTTQQPSVSAPNNRPPPSDESTPIFVSNGILARDYQSTGELRHREQGQSSNDRTKPAQPDSAESNNGSPDQREESFVRKALNKYGSIELENKGSVARDHLALERTFLAWLRTSLAFSSIGITITQLFRLNTAMPSQSASTPADRLRAVGKPLGATFVGIGIVVLYIGFQRYFESQYWVMRGKFPASRGSIALVSFLAGALIVASFVVMLVISPSAIAS